MNSGEEETSPILRASRVQSSSFMLPLRMWLSGIFASADSSRMVISLRVISREKITLVMLWWIDADRQKSRPSVDFPIGGPRRDDHHLAGVQAVGELVEVGEAGRDADHLAVAVVDRLDLVERRLHDRAQRRVVVRGPLVGDAVDLGLGPVDDLVDLALAGVPHLGDPGAGVDEPPQDRLLAHDLGVVAGVGGDRHARREGVEVRRAADPRELAAALQLGRRGDRVDRLAAAVEVDHRVVDRLVRPGGRSRAPRTDSMTSAIASLESSIEPSTLCSASLSCGGVRSPPPPPPPPPRRRERRARPPVLHRERRLGVGGEAAARGRDAHRGSTSATRLSRDDSRERFQHPPTVRRDRDRPSRSADATGPRSHATARRPQAPGDNRRARVQHAAGHVHSL